MCASVRASVCANVSLSCKLVQGNGANVLKIAPAAALNLGTCTDVTLAATTFCLLSSPLSSFCILLSAFCSLLSHLISLSLSLTLTISLSLSRVAFLFLQIPY